MPVGVKWVVEPRHITAHRLAYKVVRSGLMNVTDSLLGSAGHKQILKVIPVGWGSRLAGRRLDECDNVDRFCRTILGLASCSTADFLYHPAGAAVVPAGGRVVALEKSRPWRRLHVALNKVAK